MINNIYIVHWKELTDRKQYLDEQLSKYSPIWIDFFDRNTVLEEEIRKIYKKARTKKYLNDKLIFLFLSKIKNMKP